MEKIKFDFKSRTAIVTGGAQGFGFDITKRFLKSGANVIMWDNDPKAIDLAIKEIDSPNLSSHVVDVSNYEEVDKIVNKGKIGKNVYKLYELSKGIAKNNIPLLACKKWDSHIMVEVMMVLANKCVAEYLYESVPGRVILRSHSGINSDIKDVPEGIRNRIRIMNSSSAKYTTEYSYHSGLGIQCYTHYTSPIRRIIDLYTHYLIKEVKFGIRMPEQMRILPYDLSTINKRVSASKRYEYTLNKLYIYRELKELLHNCDTVTGYIVELGDNISRIYVERYNIVLSHNIIHPDIKDLYIFSLNYDHMGNIHRLMYEREDGLEPQYTLELYKKYNIKMVAVSSDRIRDRIRFEYIYD